MFKKIEEAQFICDNHNGVYSPKVIAEWLSDNYSKTGILLTPEQVELVTDLLNGPDTDYYWDQFDRLLNETINHATKGECLIVHNDDGDYWITTKDNLSEEYFG